jgi:hypothetical protein
MEEAMKKEIKSKSEPVDVLDNSEPNESPDMREMDVPETEKDEAPSVDELRKAEADMKERIGVNMPQPDMQPPMMSGNTGEFTMNPFAQASAQQPVPPYCQPGNAPIPPGEKPAANPVPSWRTYDYASWPTYEEAVKQVLPEFDDFTFGDDELIHANDSALHEYTTMIWYKVRTPIQADGRDYKVLGMPKYPKFLQRLGVQSLDGVTLMQINETFALDALKRNLEKNDENCGVVEAAHVIIARMVRENRLNAGTLTSEDISVISQFIPEYSEATVQAVKEYVRRVYDTEKPRNCPTLLYTSEPRMDCTVIDMAENGSTLDDGIPLTKEIVEADINRVKRVNCPVGAPPKMQPNAEAYTKLFSRRTDLPGNMVKRILTLPSDVWDILLKGNLFSLSHSVGTRYIKIEILSGEGYSPFFNIEYNVSRGGGETRYQRSFETVDDMLKSGPNTVKLLNFAAKKFSGVIA